MMIIVLNCIIFLDVFMIVLAPLEALMAGQTLYPVFICYDCSNLDWTIHYLSSKTTGPKFTHIHATVIIPCQSN